MNRQLAAEAIGTFILVFAGTGAIVINDASGGAISHAGIALTFGLVVTTLIYSLGDVSGAHLNPAVTLGLGIAGKFPAIRIPGYILAQVAGAATASGVLKLLYPQHPTLGATLPADGWLQSFVLEAILTAMLMFVILNVTAPGNPSGAFAGLAIGGLIGLEAMFAGPACGASMNPARSLAPAVISGATTHLWVYLTAPFLGACLGVVAAMCVRSAESDSREVNAG